MNMSAWLQSEEDIFRELAPGNMSDFLNAYGEAATVNEMRSIS